MDLEIVCYLSLRQDLWHASLIYTALCDLSNQGTAQVKFEVPRGDQSFDAESLYTVCMQVKFRKSGGNRLLAIDLLDRSDSFEIGPLKKCDVYLKRNYYQPHLLELPSEWRAKVIPFGLNYPCRSLASIQMIATTLVPKFVSNLTHPPWPGLKELRERTNNLWQFLSSPDPRAFERSPEEIAEPTILFQTRVWSPAEISENAHEINGERVALVRALRKAFGSRFQGGLVPTSYASEHYPDEISRHSSKSSQYAKWGRKTLIGVNTEGLHHSLAFKLSEYLAGSKCVVSCPLRNELPAPLIEDQHYLVFRTPEQCVDRCARLLDDRKLAASLREEAWNYYRREVEPAAHLHSCLVRSSQFQYTGSLE
jgi:hypothetical protein